MTIAADRALIGPHRRIADLQQLGTAQTVSDARIRKMLSP
jgi:hypothetical protein